ncbi:MULTISPECIES: HAMP domain-containing sensor histidine kinase [Comamonadaceae]|jgi:signal transduction histidine kinase|uniref:HAMP domain-containing sensor histidine kinase n=1 Tax=Comamonadaceae TaxID=80864 RepID=UPI000BD70EC5|nr:MULTISPECIES: HAMP domain-containing sensor histidine kinase [Comamonadaceae]OYY33044.1 MAG: two-component sensor histidine kinase [Polaromonas sp. 35-63-35]OYZ17223.1 MAG: two-component sensor histidine kinase [Polaromonas sp. 16-63-31]OYZ76475.1 MAG: two-component sensor histidine kinase [Polaromonas sp. 24-63-21]OZA47580.1 MAG: two-component sensor histidine kinase [Polaromonas sp. 17-63-33]OZA85660.1 MAG: two-component sensor histidine kinase [Polaromonas sp. 39-63-25]
MTHPQAIPAARRRWRHSLRLRLVTVFLLLALAMAAVFMGGMQRIFSTGWRDAARPLVADYMDRLVQEIGTPPDVARAHALAERLPIAIRIEGPQVNWQSHPDRPEHRERAGFGGRVGDWLSRPTADGHRVSFGLGTVPWQRGPHSPVGWITLALLLALIAAAYVYVRRLLRPLDDIGAGAERFGHGDFDAPIPLRRRDELGDLAQRINTMAQDIKGMLDAKRGLLLALSHELRSPLTRARLNAELLPTSADGSAAGERERAALLRDLNEMRDLISDLLESERLASPHATLQREPVDLAALVREVVADMPDAAAVTLDLAAGLPALALDRTRMRLLLRNLLDNALRYSAEADQPPRITLTRQDGGVLLEVRDFGPGVSAEQLARLTEPFYRTDSARQRATGGVGLGMYLCQLVAQAHGSRLQVDNAATGLRVQLLLKE